MKSIAIALKDFSIRFKDRKAMIIMILMPIILTMILGSALKGVMGDSSSIPKTTISVFQQDSDSFSKQFVEKVLQDKKLKKSLVVKKVDSQMELNKTIKNEKADVGVVIPKNWGKGLKDNTVQPAIIKVSSGKEMEAYFVKQIIESYLKNSLAVTASTQMVLTDLATHGMKPDDLKKASTGLTSTLLAKTNQESSFVKDQSVGKKQVSSIQYYAAAMAAMFLLFNAMHGGKSIIAERENVTLSRMMASPTGKGSIITGKFLGTLLYSIIQFLIFIAASHFILKVDWGDNVLQTIAIAGAYSVSVSGLSMIVAAFMKTEKMADSVGGMLVQVLSLIGGSMIPVSAFPSVLRKISMAAPNSWALTSFTNIMSGTTWSTLMIPLFTLLGIGLVAAMIGTLRLRTITN